MNSGDFLLLTVDLGSAIPNPARAAEILGVPLADFDQMFGLLPVEIGGDVYAVRVRSEHLNLPRAGVEGPFADPPIGPTTV
jgi:hypothetical protein